MSASEPSLLETVDVVRDFGRGVRALNGVQIEVKRGRSVGIAGESGSGKSTLLRLLLALDKPTDGEIRFDGQDVAGFSRAARHDYRARVQAVFQDPSGSFNPRQKMSSILTEPIGMQRRLSSQERQEVAADLLRSVDLPAAFADRYPHELSGGQKQRVAIARALGCQPQVVLLDEPVTALDISVRGAILNLLKSKAAQSDVTYVVVSHDLSAIFHLTDYLYVMRRGIVVESGPTLDLVTAPVHPYTRRLVEAIGDPLAGYRGGTQETSGATSPTSPEPPDDLPLSEISEGHLARV